MTSPKKDGENDMKINGFPNPINIIKETNSQTLSFIHSELVNGVNSNVKPDYNLDIKFWSKSMKVKNLENN